MSSFNFCSLEGTAINKRNLTKTSACVLQRFSAFYREMTKRSGGIIERYGEFLPVDVRTRVVSLGEGSTPLVQAPHLSAAIGARVLLKCEHLNPTASFKDRGMTVAVSKAVTNGVRTLICASTGNTSASAAAYAARAGVGCAVVLPAGKIARGKLVQAIAHGAKIIALDGNFDDALRIVRELAERGEYSVVNSINPDRIAGQKTVAFEVIEELGDAPDIHVLPLGNAGNLTAHWRGYCEFFDEQKCTQRPIMIAIEAAGAAPVYYNRVIEKPETVASAIRIGNPASWEFAQRALDESNGRVEIVSDAEILEAQSWLATREGIFVEPASAAPIAGLLKIKERSRDALQGARTIVCTVTGHGLKDPEAIHFNAGAAVASSTDAVAAAITHS